MNQAGPARGPGWRAWPGWRARIAKSLPLAVIWVPLLINAAHVLVTLTELAVASRLEFLVLSMQAMD
jgi:hypothetical protein